MKQLAMGLVILPILVSIGCVGTLESGDDLSQGDESDVADVSQDLAPTGKDSGTLMSFEAKASPTAGLAAGITNHGGPVMTGTSNKIYYIWYGNWAGNSATTILTDFASSFGGSPYYNINTTYTSTSGTPVSNVIAYGGSTTVSYPYGNSLTDAKIKSIVSDAINGGTLPKDGNAIYLVLTSSDVTASSGFCTQYCGWHTYAAIGGVNIKYSFVGNPDRCPASCAAQTTGPNGNAGADGMASIIAHEIEEAITDPQLNAWYDASGYENADKCAWTFGTQYTTPNGAQANMKLGARDYLIQQNWVNSGAGYCAKSF
jgi:hypothetical protein